MRGLGVVLVLRALVSAALAASLLPACEKTTAENLAAAIAAEKPKQPSTPSATAAAAAPPAAVAAAPPIPPAPAPEPAATPSAALPAAAPAMEVEPVALEALTATTKFRQTNTYNGNVVYVPADCQGSYDIILHFHGAHPYVRDLVEKSGIHAVTAVFNAGNGAEKYGQAFQAGGMLSSLLRQVQMATSPLCPGAKPGRIALTAWSAGYAAVEKLVSRPEDRDRVDAVLLADGLHAGFAHKLKRELAPNALQAFRDFAELAKADKKLFAITHSSIMTDGYASTTECSRLLLKELSVPCEDKLVSGKAGSFSIEGSTGNDKEAHIQQFRRMDSALLSKLKARWKN